MIMEAFMMKITEEAWQRMKDLLGYDKEEMELFRKNSTNEKVLARLPEMLNKTVVFEVIESKGCASGHRAGDKFYFDASGNLLTKLNPKKICISALVPLNAIIHAVREMIFAGIDPNEMLFKTTGCSDTGVKCGGWGHVAMRCQVEDRKKNDA
jgi:uncharacterized repeat protein (TIGR04076 family)